MSNLKLIKNVNDVELWHLTHPDADVEVFTVKDPRRTPEDWAFGSAEEARLKFDERVENAKTERPTF